jgi:type II secretory pathway component PulK
VTVHVLDAQNRFNLNRLSQPLSPSMVRTPDDMFGDLVRFSGMEDENNLSRTVGPWLRLHDIELHDPWQLVSIQPEYVEFLSYLGPQVVCLPRPQTGAVKVNLNTVDPDVLTAILGPQFRGWVQSVLNFREAAPIPSVSAVTRGLPAIAQSVLPDVLDVRSEYFEIRVTATKDSIQREKVTLVRCPSTGRVEVVRCP